MPYLIIQSYVVTPGRSFRHVYPMNGIHFTAEELVSIVQGHIRIIQLKGDYQGKVLVVTANAEGKDLNLKHNSIASKISRRRIYGNALVCERSLIK